MPAPPHFPDVTSVDSIYDSIIGMFFRKWYFHFLIMALLLTIAQLGSLEYLPSSSQYFLSLDMLWIFDTDANTSCRTSSS